MSNDRSVLNLNDYPEFRPVDNNSSGPLPPGGGPPYDGDMERRVSKLEDKMDSVQSTLTDIRVALTDIRANMATQADVANLKEEVNKRPTRMGLWGAVATAVALASGVGAFVVNVGHIFHN